MTDAIKTERLTLRRPVSGDAPAIARLISHWDVVKWLSSAPWPYRLSDAEWFLGDAMSRTAFAIEVADQFAGIVGLDPSDCGDGHELGYWLGKPFWGQGIMTEATQAVVADHFAHSHDPLESGYFVGNGPSQNVLAKLGFRDLDIVVRHSRPQQKDLPLQRVAQSYQDWRDHYG